MAADPRTCELPAGSAKLGKRGLVSLCHVVAEAAEHNPGNLGRLGKKRGHFPNRNSRRLAHRIAICTATDRRKSKSFQPVRVRKLQALAIRACQKLGLAPFAAVPN